MNTVRSVDDFYVTGGTMPPDAESYVVRTADDELFRAIDNGEFCYVLTTRQMGKSSLMARTAERLAQNGVRSAQISLETIRESRADPSSDQFLYSAAWRIHKELGLPVPLSNWWDERKRLSSTQRFHEFLTELLLEGCDSRIVVFIDEIDSTIGLPFADDFYATIRACFNGRASKPALNRLTFVLLGVATPAQLIADPRRTPFNIGKGIELTDFTVEEARVLASAFQGTAEDRQVLLDRVLYWTGGHPYLTQKLCRAIGMRSQNNFATNDGSFNLTAIVDEEVNKLFLRSEASREESNLKFVRSRLTQGYRDLQTVLGTYSQVLAGKVVEDEPNSPIHASLKLAGVVRVDARARLQPRNQIYWRVFGQEWVKEEFHSDRSWILGFAAVVAVLIVGVLGALALRQAQTSTQAQAEMALALKPALLEGLTTSNFGSLVLLAREHNYRWEPATIALSSDFLARVNPKVFTEGPWLTGDPDPENLFLVIDRGHELFIPSRPLFGAMSFALEEVFLRAPADSSARERARLLAQKIRAAFIDYHREETPFFQAPPRRKQADQLNVWIQLPGGRFEMGSNDGDRSEQPVHEVHLTQFLMQQHEVTNDEYSRFDPTVKFSQGEGRHPVQNITWYESAAYAAWLGASLPSEAQWEYAAKGTGTSNGRRYPWGDSLSPRVLLDYNRRGSMPVGSHPAGRTPEGLDDMSGDGLEWCRDWFNPYDGSIVFDPIGPIVLGVINASREPLRVWRGDYFGQNGPRTTVRGASAPDERGAINFRLVNSRLEIH